jgi:hypothetical protein
MPCMRQYDGNGLWIARYLDSHTQPVGGGNGDRVRLSSNGDGRGDGEGERFAGFPRYGRRPQMHPSTGWAQPRQPTPHWPKERQKAWEW